MELLRLNLQHFAEASETGEAGNAENAPTANLDGQSPDEAELNAPESESQAPKTFTQEELDKIVADRVARANKKLDKFADYDDLKTKAAEYERFKEEQENAKLSEKERLEKLAKKYEDEKSQLAAELEAVRETVKAEKIRNEFIKVATSENIAYIDDALALADLTAVSLDEDGKVVGMADVIKTLVDNKPFLLAKPKPKPIGESTNGNTERADKTAEQLLKEAAEKAKASGRIEDRVAFDKLKRQLRG